LISTLNDAFLIASEDTRTTKKLLNRYEIPSSKLVSYHDNSPNERLEYIISVLKEGKDVALVSESGTPLISDPGYKLIRGCISNDIIIKAIPGPSAAISALILSGLPTDSFLFLGFLPKSKTKLSAKIKQVLSLPYTLVIYESPNRVISTLEIIKNIMGDRNVSVLRELTKIYEEVIRGTLAEVISRLSKRNIKGEVVIVLEGYKSSKIDDFKLTEIEKEFKGHIKDGLTKKEVIKILMAKYDIGRQKLYNISTKI
jgi:16S rRNA (cytidine1402-2'-O)-methyltransferase